MKKKTLYEFFEIEPEATPEEVKAAAQKLARKFHPSKYPGNAKVVARFEKIKQVYNILGNAKKRAAYDAALAKKMAQTQTPDSSSVKSANNGYSDLKKNLDSTSYLNTSREIILYRADLHWISYFKSFFLIGIAIYWLFFATDLLTAISSQVEIPYLYVEYAGYGLLVWGGLWLLYTLLFQYSTVVMITTQKTTAKFGILFRQKIDIPHPQLEKIGIKQSIVGKLLNFGTLKIKGTEMSGKDNKIKINNLAAPRQFETLLTQIVNNY
jgi:hypothetical protein